MYVIYLFTTTTDGDVLFRGDESMKIATLSADGFTKIIITVDIASAIAYALNEYGDVLFSVTLQIPDAAAEPKPKTFSEWYARMANPFQWYFTADSAIAFDNLKVYTGNFESELIPEGNDRLILNVGNGALDGEAPQYYPTGTGYTLPIPKPNGENELFVGWYDNSEFSGEPIKTLDSGKAVLYAKYALPENMNRIEYVIGNAMLQDGAPVYYEAGVPVKLPMATLAHSKLNTVFCGWFFDENFTGEPVLEIYELSADREITLYALFNIVINDNDFSGNAVNITKPEDGTPVPSSPTVDGIYYQLNGKYAEVHTLTDAAGKTYIVIKTDAKNPSGTTSSCDPQIYSSSTVHRTEVRKNGGIITYDLEIAVPEGAKCGNSVFRLRSGSASDVIYLFGTNANGEILFNGDKNTVIATLGSRFTRLVFTVDLLNETLTAYNTYGEILATANIAIPDAADPKHTTLMDWFESNSNPHQWYFEKDCELAIDSYKIYAGQCKDFNYLSENENKLILNTGFGALAENAPNSYKAGERITLPIPVVNDAMVQFKGWYKTPDFTGEAVTEIEQISADAPIVLYARFGLPDI